MRRFTADFYKVVGTATCLHDNVVMTRFLEEHCQEYSMVGMCMGEQGMLSRVLGIRAGGAFTFGSETAGRATAPGQPTYRELRDLYRIEQIETVTKVYGIAGDPVSHSMSPYVMNAAFRRRTPTPSTCRCTRERSAICWQPSPTCRSMASASPCPTSRRSCSIWTTAMW